MKNKFFHSIRWKLILAFAYSLISASIITYLLTNIVYIMYHNLHIFRGLIAYSYNKIGVIPICAVTMTLLFVAIFFLATEQSIDYIEEISNNLSKIEAGNMNVTIPIKSQDELSELAMKINSMTAKLQSSIEDERRSENTKNELITSVSHDLRTPLTSIIGYLSLIENSKYRDEDELKYYANIAYQKSNKLKKLIDDLFELTRMNHGKLKINRTQIDLCNLIRQINEEFYPIFEKADLQCRLNLTSSPILIFADGDLIARVFDNIISNSIRYGKQGKYIDIQAAIEGNEVVVKIMNYGEPIPESHIPYVFDRFYRVDNSRSEFTGGAGLGLAISKNIIELHDGTICVSSDKTRTCFEIRLNHL